MDKLSVIKIGGNIIDNAGELRAFLRAFSAVEGRKILVHGGGTRATQLSRRLGHDPVMVDGRRVTTEADLDIAVMMYAGLINKQIVSLLQALGCNAAGLSGADGNLIRSAKRPVKSIDYGYVGDIEKVNGGFLSELLEADLVPVLCALTHDGKGQLLNTNADTIAAEVAIAMVNRDDVVLTYCFERDGVLMDIKDPDSVIPIIDKRMYDEMKNKGSLHSGMMPKMENCFGALERGVQSVRICSIKGLSSDLSGTRVMRG